MRELLSLTDRRKRTAQFLRRQWPQHACKQIQGLLDVSEATANRILAGDVSADSMHVLETHFGSELLKFSVPGVWAGAPAGPMAFWITEKGVQAAPAGADSYIKGLLGNLPGNIEFDAYAMRNWGWLLALVTESAIIVRCCEGAVDEVAVRHAQSWLLTQESQVIDIECERASLWIRQRHETAKLAVQALDRYAALAEAKEIVLQRLERQWSVERKALADVIDPDLRQVIQRIGETNGEADQLLKAVASTMSTTAVFSVDGDNVVSLFAGPGLGIDAPAVMGKNVLSRPDRQYGQLVHAHVLQATRERAGTFHDLSIAIDGNPAKYQRYAFASKPDIAGRRLVTTSVKVIVNPRLAA